MDEQPETIWGLPVVTVPSADEEIRVVFGDGRIREEATVTVEDGRLIVRPKGFEGE